MRAAPAIRPSSYMLAPTYLKNNLLYQYSLNEIIEIISRETKIGPNEIKSKCRFHEYTFARQLVCYVCRSLIKPNYSLGLIGRELNMDHSSAHYGDKRIANFLQIPCPEKIIIEKILQKFKREN